MMMSSGFGMFEQSPHRPRASPMPQVFLSPAQPASAAACADAFSPGRQSIKMSPSGARPSSAAKQPAAGNAVSSQTPARKPSPPSKTGERIVSAARALVPSCSQTPHGRGAVSMHAGASAHGVSRGPQAPARQRRLARPPPPGRLLGTDRWTRSKWLQARRGRTGVHTRVCSSPRVCLCRPASNASRCACAYSPCPFLSCVRSPLTAPRLAVGAALHKALWLASEWSSIRSA